MILPDTDALSQIIKKNSLSEPDLRIASIPLINRLTNDEFGISSITHAELQYQTIFQNPESQV